MPAPGAIAAGRAGALGAAGAFGRDAGRFRAAAGSAGIGSLTGRAGIAAGARAGLTRTGGLDRRAGRVVDRHPARVERLQLAAWTQVLNAMPKLATAANSIPNRDS